MQNELVEDADNQDLNARLTEAKEKLAKLQVALNIADPNQVGLRDKETNRKTSD